jgi:cytochrome c551/c552
MEIFNKFVIIQSAENLNLLIYILIISYILLIPYAGLLSAASLFSYIYRKLGIKKNNDDYKRFSHDLIFIAAFRKGLMVTFGVIPVLTIGFSYTQLFHQLDSPVLNYYLSAMVLFVSGIISLYFYKYSYRLDDVFREAGFQSEEIKNNDVRNAVQGNIRLYKKTAVWGIVLLYVSIFLIIGCIEFSITTIFIHSDKRFFGMLISWSAIFKYLTFLTLSVFILSIAVLYYINRVKEIQDMLTESYKKFVNKFALTAGMISVIILPLFIVINVFYTPYFALTGITFSFAAIILLLLFLAAHYYYVMIRYANLNYIIHLLSIVVIVSALFVANDQASFGTSSQKQILTLSQSYDKMVAQLQEKRGEAPKISGEEIYENICSACHRFDTKLVGPAYKDVLPQFENKREELVSFILNPTKKLADFPPMPNPGLNRPQAEAVADYIMKTYKTK